MYNSNYKWIRDEININDLPLNVKVFRHLSYDIVRRIRTFDGLRTTHHWFECLEPFMKNKKKTVKILEIGSHEGQSTCWFLKHIINSNSNNKIVCCDPQYVSHWGGVAYKDIFEYNLSNHLKNSDSLELYKGLSYKYYETQSENHRQFDIIYIDGCHDYPEVSIDIKNCHNLLKKNGVIIVDDYDKTYADTKTKDPSKWCDGVKKAIDEFLNIVDSDYKILHKKYQIIIQKLI